MPRALFSGVAGLKTHQTKMDVIGNNIANVNTYGFKSSRVTFKDVYYETLSGSSNANGAMGGGNATQVGYGSAIGSVDVLNTRSGFAATGLGTDCYIDGEGYFVIKDGAGNERLTQVGQMSFDGSGNLVDGQKNFVCGYPYKDMSGKAAVGGATINFGNANGTMLDGYKVEVKYAPAVTGSDATTAVAADSDKKIITVTFTPSTDMPAGNPTKALTKDELQKTLQDSAKWSPWTGTTPPTPDITKVTVEGAADDPTGVVNAATGSVIQGANFDTTKNPDKIVNTYGELKDLTIGSDGTITGQDASGTIRIIGQVAIANVPNPQALTLEGNSYFKAVNNTGTITYSAPGSKNVGQLKSGGLETSNVDLATEMSDMIMTQRGFQANSKIITVSDEMLDELCNLKR